MTLEEITKKIETMKMTQKASLNWYDEQIVSLQNDKTQKYLTTQKEIDAALEIQKTLLGDAESVETESFVISKKRPNLKSKAAYKLNLPKEKNEKVRFERYMLEEHPGLIKQEVVIKPIQNDIKQLIVDGTYHITEEGLLIDDNGVAIPNTTVDVKPVEVRVKVKTGKENFDAD